MVRNAPTTRTPRRRTRRRGWPASRAGTAAKLCYAGHLLLEHRNALIVDAELTAATGYAERDCAVEMLARLPASTRRRTVAGDKGYDTKDFVARTRTLGFTPHVAPNTTNRSLGDRWSHDPSPRPPRQSTDPQTDRGTLRLDQDHRRRTQAPLHRPSPQPSLVQDHHRRLQPAPHHRPRHRLHLTGRASTPPRPDRQPASRRRMRTETRPVSPDPTAATTTRPNGCFSAPC